MRILFVSLAMLLLAVSSGVLTQGARSWPGFKEPNRRTVAPHEPSRSRLSAKKQSPNTIARSGNSAKSGPDTWRWRIRRTAWTNRDEKGYEEFVRRIGESKCRTVHTCLTGRKANPLYHATNPRGMRFYADCADLPYMLRAYFAWKNSLPFSYSNAVAPLGACRDIRYTARGNKIIGRTDLVAPVIDVRREIPRMIDRISSAHYRYPPNYPGKILPDHYPIKITRKSIKPGTIIYDANGHVAVVYNVTKDGRIRYIDTHPDNTLTRGTYGRVFSRSSPAMGAGFKRWRPQSLVGAERQLDGSYQGGRIVLSADKEIADWSDEQFFGNELQRSRNWRRAKFIIDGEALSYHDFVRKRLARAGFKYDPIDETRSMMHGLCEDLGYRVDAVGIALRAGIHHRPQPARLPDNIYGTFGDWEIYSTPSRDARLKTAFKELRDEVSRFLALDAEGRSKLNYSGADLRRDLRKVYREQARKCRITYTRSEGSKKQLTFDEIVRRLFLMSFDPHHCAELRWGAYEKEELATCAGGAVKRSWYEAEQRLRNQLERTYNVRMGFSLSMLRRRVAGSGIDNPPKVNTWPLLEDQSRLLSQP